MRRCGWIVAGAVAAAPATAAELEARGRIDAVTVFPDAAQITRVLDVDLPAGASVVVVRGAPMAADPTSFTAAGVGQGKIVIASVDARIAPDDARAGDSALEAKLRVLRGEREGWQASVDALTLKRAMIVRYSEASPEKLSADSAPLPVDQWAAAFDKIGEHLAKTGDDLRAAQARLKGLDDEIKGLEAAGARTPRKTPQREVAIAVDADTPTKARLTLDYRVTGAGWRPVYDARLATGAGGAQPTLDLVRRAAIAQRTGEDWTDVALTVATARAMRGAAAPDVGSERAAFLEPPVALRAPAPAKALRSDSRNAAPQAAIAGGPAAAEAEADVAPAPVEHKTATLEAGAWSSSFIAPGRVSAPSDGSTHTIHLSQRRYQPQLALKTAPALDPTAYLEAHLTNEEEAPLLAGEVSIQRDGAYVGASRLATTAPGEGFDLGFGADDRVRVTRAPVLRKENEPTWFGQTKTEAREFKTTVKNLHDFPVHVSVIDRAPFSENSAITVDLLGQTTPPIEKQVGDKRGVMRWALDLGPQEQKEIKLGWRMKWPAERDVVLQPVAPTPR